MVLNDKFLKLYMLSKYGSNDYKYDIILQKSSSMLPQLRKRKQISNKYREKHKKKISKISKLNNSNNSA